MEFYSGLKAKLLDVRFPLGVKVSEPGGFR
jgi:hypothetical protein